MTAHPGLVIFDCDGVIVDTEKTANLVLAAWLTEAGFPVAYEECRRRYSGRSMASVQAEIAAAGHDLGFDLPIRWYDALTETFGAGVEPVPYIEFAVEALRAANVPWCVASSAKLDKMYLTLGTTGLLPLFEHALFSATMVEHGKPAPDLFLHAARRMDVEPARCAVVEDSVPGTVAGVAAGMRVFSYCGDPFADRAALEAAGGILFDDMRRLPALLLGA